MSDRPGKGTGCVVLLLFSFFVVWAMMPEPHGPVAPAKASYVISDLREMRTAAWALFADSADEVGRWTALPDGLTSVDAPFALFWKYVDNYTKYEDRGPSWRSPPDWGRPCGCAPMSYPKGPFFSLEIVSVDDDVLWRAGAIVSNDGRYDELVREKLAGKARSIGLLNARGELYTEADDVVYMVWRLSEMADARARPIVGELRDTMGAAFALCSLEPEGRMWPMIPHELSPSEAAERWLGKEPDLWRLAFRRHETHEDAIWMMGRVVSHDARVVRDRLIAHAEEAGLLDEDGRPYSGGDVVWAGWSFDEMKEGWKAGSVVHALRMDRARASMALAARAMTSADMQDVLVPTSPFECGLLWPFDDAALPPSGLTSRDVRGGTLWLVGRRLGKTAPRELLVAWASRWGLVDKDGAPYSGGDIVYMLVSLDAGAR